MPESIRLMVVDDHQVILEAAEVAFARTDDLVVVATCNKAVAVLETAEQAQPDVVLMNMNMPEGLVGPELTRQLMAAHPAIKVLILSALSPGETIDEALAAGAVSYLPKNSPVDELLGLIRAAAGGDSTDA